MDSKIAAVVTFYFPHSSVIQNIKSYAGSIDKLFVVDNSETSDNQIVQRLKSINNVLYLPQHENKGIAFALNLASELAIQEGYEYLLTMDQDGVASPDMVKKLIQCFSLDKKIAVVSAFHHFEVGRKSINRPSGCNQTLTVMTSGNIININILKKIGGFNNDLFIDYVDHDFCLRLNRAGYKVFICNSAILKHNLGEIKQKFFFSRKVYPTNHSPIRMYYRTRNRFYVYKKNQDHFADYIRNDKMAFIKEILKIIIYEKNKLLKIKMIIIGYSDYRKNKFGKFIAKTKT